MSGSTVIGTIDSVIGPIIRFLAPVLDRVGLHSTWQVLAYGLLMALTIALTYQLYSWLTPPKPKNALALGLGISSSIVIIIGISIYAPIIPAIFGAAIVGVYGWTGYAYVISIIFLCGVMGFNAIEGWKQNRPLEVFQ